VDADVPSWYEEVAVQASPRPSEKLRPLPSGGTLGSGPFRFLALRSSHHPFLTQHVARSSPRARLPRAGCPCAPTAWRASSSALHPARARGGASLRSARPRHRRAAIAQRSGATRQQRVREIGSERQTARCRASSRSRPGHPSRYSLAPQPAPFPPPLASKQARPRGHWTACNTIRGSTSRPSH
jgi:hypothetical protein